MTRNRKLIIASVAALAVGGGAVGIAQAVNGDSEEQVKGPEADRAGQAAVHAVGGGRAVEVERDDEGGDGWEVEVARTDGRQVEVHLDRSLRPTGTQPDDDGSGGERGDDD